MIFFTSSCSNYIPKARVMAHSLKRHHPGAFVALCLVERNIHPAAKDSDLFDLVITAEDLGIENFESFMFKHSLIEASTAIKGYLLKKLMRDFPRKQKFIYLDPDILVTGPFTELFQALEIHDIILTPHICEPEETLEGIQDNEITILNHGVFNLGFLAVKRSKETARFIQWWASRLEEFCYADQTRGLFVDQRWVDLAPCLFDVLVFKHPAYNVARWNLSRRHLMQKEQGEFYVQGEPLRFFHFSQFDSGIHDAMVARYCENRQEAVLKIRKLYTELLEKHGQQELGKLPWSYNFYGNGAEINDDHRIIYRKNKNLQSQFKNPFLTDKSPSFYDYINNYKRMQYKNGLTEDPNGRKQEAYTNKLISTLQDKEAWIISLEDIIRDKDARISELEIHENNIYNSLGWRLLAGCRKILDKIFPLHTRGRLLAKLVLQTILNPAKVLKNLNLANTAKFIHHLINTDPSVLEEIIRAKLSGQTVNQPLFLAQVGGKKNLNLNELEHINFKTLEPPQVSIIIPVYNNWEYTYSCLKSIHLNTNPDIPFEIIIADDASTDETVRMLSHISGIKVINNQINLGFLKNCNQAAEHAQGKYILFLNNDTEVKAGWLANLLKTAESDEKIGLVGGKLLYPDGRIQEAGGVLGKDGLEYPFGRFDDPEKYEYNYVKEVDCLIGACLLIRKDVFFEVGKFNEIYAPAFYEEFDLEFALREAGYKIMYQPQTVIIHHLSSSYGPEARDSQSGRNKAKFMERWAHRLEEQPEPEEDIFLARDRSKNKKIILVIDDRVPDYDNHAGSLLTYQYLRLFQEMGLKVIFIPNSLTSPEPYTSELQQLGIEVVYGPFEFTSWIKQNGRYLHYAWLARPEVAVKYIDAIKRYSPAKILYLTVDLHYLRELRRYQIEKTAEALKKSKRFRKLEFSLFEKADWILTPSDYERTIIKKEFPGKPVAAIPIHYYETNSAKEKTAANFEERNGLLFLGGFRHVPNVDAVKWLVNDIYPVIKQKIPDLKLYIIGSNPPADITAFDNTDIIVTGYVKDLEPLFCRARVFVSPLRYGAGVKGKIITSLSYGVPVVTTSIGNEGINLVEGMEAFIADDPVEFANKTVELYKNPEVWMKLSKNSLSFIKHNFSKDKAKHTIMEALDIVIGKS